MMGGYASEAYAGLDLSPDQRRKIAGIQQETGKAQWQLMGAMHESGLSHARHVRPRSS